ncbi:MAG TPA: NAD(P)H-hydrate dehydratase [Acidimicrobiales bacterium]|nr:NAD(P)H-hydrate dehydratase [Acidimicrobiales bacterium]
MRPLLDSAAMRDADAAAVAIVGATALVRRAGVAVAQECRGLLGALYGRRVAVVAGPGLNGADGRVCAEWLARRGARVEVFSVADQPAALTGYDLIVDAAFGLGCSRPYHAPLGDAPVVAVDLPSGVDADTGDLWGSPARATITVALGALKPAHVTGPAAALAGRVVLRRLGIVGEARDGVVEDGDLARYVTRSRDDHKWRHAVAALAGSPLMPGAASLVASGALAGGASMVRLASRADVTTLDLPAEVVRVTAGALDSRVRAVVAGPGLGEGSATWLGPMLAGVSVPVVLDADALDPTLLADRRHDGPTWVLTPHDGEFARLTGRPVPADRIGATRALAAASGCVVLLKGPVTIVAAPEGATRVITSGTTALATAGTGDVLAGLIGGALARGHDPLEAAALSAHLHGRAGARLAPYAGASDLPRRVAEVLARTIP